MTLLLLAAALFAIGLYGLLSRRNAVAVLLSIELMMNAANINLVAFAPGGQAIAVFALALTVAEIVVGLAIVLVLFRQKKHVLVDEAKELRQ